jgi:hypothetical protein
MANLSHDDISYAMEATRVLHEPDRRIDTFGSTNFEFCLVSELMDSVNVVRVREGRIEAERPRILKPKGYDSLNFEGFGEQAEAFEEWFRQFGGDLTFLRYGFSFIKTNVVESMVHDPFEVVCDRVVNEVRDAGDPSKAVIQGVDDTWEISLLKFNMDMIEQSQGINVFDFKRRGQL